MILFVLTFVIGIPAAIIVGYPLARLMFRPSAELQAAKTRIPEGAVHP